MKTTATDVNPEDYDLLKEASMAVGDFDDSSEDDYDEEEMELLSSPPTPGPGPGPAPVFVDVQTQCDLMEDTGSEEPSFEGLPPEEPGEISLACDCLKCAQRAAVFQ